MHTTIGDPTVEAVAGLDRLESVSVFDTPVTPAVLPKVESMRYLKHFYAGQTGISAASISPALKGKVVF